MEVSCQLHAPAALPAGKHPVSPLHMRLDGHQSRSRPYGGKILLPRQGMEPQLIGHPACNIVYTACHLIKLRDTVSFY
jgi:hypothetical protein